MRSFDSPGRIVTLRNAGPGAVAVVADQPYRLRSHQGITQHKAGLGDELNLVTEGVFMQFVSLANGVASARDGDLVHVSLDGSWTLHVGFGEAGAEGYAPFGLLGDALRGTDLVRVKVIASVAANVASGGGGGDAGGGGGSDPALGGRMTEAEGDIVALQAADTALDVRLDVVELAQVGIEDRVGDAEQAITALQADGGGGGSAPVLAAGTIMTLPDAANKAGFLPMRGNVYQRSAHAGLSPLFPGNSGANATEWSSSGQSVGSSYLNGGATYFKGKFLFGSATYATVNLTTTGSTMTQKNLPFPGRCFADDGAFVWAFGGTSSAKSADGETWVGSNLIWTGTAPGSGYTVNGALFDGGELLIVGNGQNPPDFDLVGISVDGINFARQATSIDRQLHDVAVGTINGQKVYMVVGDAGTIAVSPDKRVWTLLNSRCSQTLRTVVFDPVNQRFLAFGQSGRMVVSDGTICDPYIVDSAMADIYGSSIGGGVVVIAGSSNAIEGRSRFKVASLSDVSPTGWTDRLLTGSAQPSPTISYNVVHGGGRFIAPFQAIMSNGYPGDFLAASAAPDLNPATQFIIPPLPANAPGYSNWIKA